MHKNDKIIFSGVKTMSKVKKFLTKALLLAVMIAAVGTSSFAADSGVQKNVFTKSPEYFKAEKSAEARQEYYKAHPSKKPILADKNSSVGGFSTNGFGTYPTRKGVILITDSPGGSIGKILGHAGIIWSSYYTEESFAESFSPKEIDGVWYYDNDWDERYSEDKVYGISVYDTTAAEDAEVADWCEDQEGKPYNWNFFNWGTRDSFYCSQLVYAGYLDNFDIDIWGYSDFILPMDLYYNENTYTLYEN